MYQKQIIQNFKDDTAARYDKVTVKIIKSICEVIILLHLFIFII